MEQRGSRKGCSVNAWQAQQSGVLVRCPLLGSWAGRMFFFNDCDQQSGVLVVKRLKWRDIRRKLEGTGGKWAFKKYGDDEE